MVSCTSGCFLNVINLANSIIGVSILAMPYCFQKCGILLSLLLIVVSGTLVRAACYLLLKCAIMARRRNFEYLAFHALGSTGKLAVEIGIIGFLIGVCIAFFVVVGDLGPPLASQYMMVENTPNLRAEVLVFLGLFVALPLGLLKNVSSLTSLSAFSIAFYCWLVLKIFSEAAAKLILNEWWHQVNWWQLDGLLPCLPIFSMALSCQTQLFEFFDTLSEPSLKRMMTVVNGAVYLCSSVYILVGFFGYIACYDKTITGNILVNLTPSVITECIKLVFVVTVVISFPLCLFPCRTSLHSLLFKQGLGHHEIAVNFIPDHRFRFLTISLVIVTIGVAIMIPNIEFALGIIGSTIGTMICLIFPAIVFIHDTNKNTTEKRLAQVVLCIGLFIFFACTYSTLKEGTQTKNALHIPKNPVATLPHVVMDMSLVATSSLGPLPKAKEVISNIEVNNLPNMIGEKQDIKVNNLKDVANEKRQEPPIPREPEIKAVKVEQKVDLDPQALQKEDKELQKETLQQNPTSVNIVDVSLKEKQEQILRKLEEQQKEQKIIIEQQKKVLEELKLHRESHEEALKEKKDIESKDVNHIPKDVHVIKTSEKLENNRFSTIAPSLVSKNSVLSDNQINKKNRVKSNNEVLIKQRLTNFSSGNLPVMPHIIKQDVNLLAKQNDKNEVFIDKNRIPEKHIPISNEAENKTVVKKEQGNPKPLHVSDSARERVISQKDIKVPKTGVENQQQSAAADDDATHLKSRQLNLESKTKHKSSFPNIHDQRNQSSFETQNNKSPETQVDKEKHEMR